MSGFTGPVQLSAACESTNCFRILRKIGVPDDMLRTAVWQQILVYFGFPLAVALADTIVWLQLLNNFLNPFHLNIFSSISILILLLFTFVFLEYLYVTFRGCQALTAPDEAT